MKKLPLYYFLMLLLLAGCTHDWYTPNSQNVPGFKEMNEVRFSGAATFSDKVGGDIQAGYAVTNHVGIIANATIVHPFSRSADSGSSSITDGRSHLYEIG